MGHGTGNPEDGSSSSKQISNLLHDLGVKVSSDEVQGPSAQQGGTGTYVSDGLPPVPAKIAAKIGRWEFIEMYELLPEFWTQKGDEVASKTSTSSRAKAKKRVQDINVWLQCFALYVYLV